MIKLFTANCENNLNIQWSLFSVISPHNPSLKFVLLPCHRLPRRRTGERSMRTSLSRSGTLRRWRRSSRPGVTSPTSPRPPPPSTQTINNVRTVTGASPRPPPTDIYRSARTRSHGRRLPNITNDARPPPTDIYWSVWIRSHGRRLPNTTNDARPPPTDIYRSVRTRSHGRRLLDTAGDARAQKQYKQW